MRVPTENLVSPDLVRRLCWEWEDISQSSPDPIAAVEAYLRTGQARAWQLELVVPILTSALEVVAANDELRAPMEQATPLRRLGDPVDIAAAAVYLASPAGSFLTGKTLEVDGGLTFPNLDLPIPDL